MEILFLIGRILLGGFFLKNAYAHFTRTPELTAYAESKGVKGAKFGVVASGFLLLAGGLSILLGVWPWAGIWAITLFFIGVTPVMHSFWKIKDPSLRMAEKIQFEKNLALLGAVLMLHLLPTPWALALPW